MVAGCGHVGEGAGGGQRGCVVHGRRRCAPAHRPHVHSPPGAQRPAPPLAASICGAVREVQPVLAGTRRNSAARASLSSSAACTSVSARASWCKSSSVMPSRNCLLASGRLASLSKGVIASSGRYTRLMRPGFFGSSLSVANRHGRCKFRNGLRYSRQKVLKRPAWRSDERRAQHGRQVQAGMVKIVGGLHGARRQG